MKKITLFIFINLIFSCVSFSQTWNEVASPVTYNVIYFTAYDNNYAWFGIQSTSFYRTTNGGNSWINITSPVNPPKLYAFGQNDVFLSEYNLLKKSTNGGQNWFQVHSIYHGSSAVITDLCMLNTSTGYVNGGNPNGNIRFGLFKTVDGGWSWDSTGLYVNNTGTSQPRGLFALGSYLWIGSSQNKVFYSSDNGSTWQTRTIGGELGYYIWFNSTSLGMVYTTGGQAWFTTNSGNTWIPAAQALPSNIMGVFGSANRFWVAAGDKIFSTTNNGTNWTTEYTALNGTYTTMAKTWLSGDGSVWAGRNNGGITKGINITGIQPVNSTIPAKFSLEQNYPNPFNPETNIRFGIPKESFTKIIIYDILGKEIDNIVNEKLSPGTYEVKWNASNYPSGVYIYRLQTESFSDMKKMVLVK